MDGGTHVLTDTVSDHLYPALFQCFTIIVCGYVAGRLNVVSKVESKGIATFVGTFALPSLIFLSLARLDFSSVNWTFLLAILLGKGLVFFAVIIVTLSITKPMNLGQAGIFAIFCTQSNDFALGYPIINAIYEKTHPEYALYLYLMAPISLAILNPLAFVLMEIHKQRQYPPAAAVETRRHLHNFKMLLQLTKGIVFNPVLVMTVLGIIGNIAFKHQLSVYIEGLLDVFGQSFSAAALFLLGLRMVGQITRLKGPALLLPCVLIMVKLIILPVIMRECVSTLDAGVNATETQALSTYAFLYGTIPTAPAVFVFSNLYQLEIDLMASSMVICTFLSAPIIFLSSQMMSITKDYAGQITKFGFDLSIVSLIAALWVVIVFSVTKKYKRMPHRLTLSIVLTQIFLAISVILMGPKGVPADPSWYDVLLQAMQIFTTYSCFMWTPMLTVGLLMLEIRGPCFAATLWPVLAFVAWGTAGVMMLVLLLTREAGPIDAAAAGAIRLGLVIFSITLTTGCLILYVRFRRRSSLFPRSAEDMLVDPSPPNETSSLVENAEPNSHTQSVSNFGCYGTITTTPSPNMNCCSSDPNCSNGHLAADAHDIEDMANNGRTCACPPTQKLRCSAAETCPYLNELEEAANELGLLPPEQSHGRGGQLLRHTVLVIVYTLTMFLDLTYIGWKIMRKDESGVYIEIEYLDTAAVNGQALIMFILFGLDPEEMLIPAVRYLRKKWYGADTVVLPAVEDLSFETKHVCDQFIKHHLDRCKEAIAKDTRWRMRTYRNVFRGSCLVRWLVQCGLAGDAREAVTYARHLLDGRLIAHVHKQHHFTDSPLLYTFN
ncbi:integral membrane protein GPR155 isoform X2 [Bicyclus anynana]|uniref:Integral membrane protein GPR155 isoform X2 n=1 Tax=Bicyclus anynana TaxID=110368 RepID=A0A6J1MQJ3_BICAN|nr:integral membrane protein GPR155 isoform X2 [Bicyclus anynana]